MLPHLTQTSHYWIQLSPNWVSPQPNPKWVNLPLININSAPNGLTQPQSRSTLSLLAQTSPNWIQLSPNCVSLKWANLAPSNSDQSYLASIQPQLGQPCPNWSKLSLTGINPALIGNNPAPNGSTQLQLGPSFSNLINLFQLSCTNLALIWFIQAWGTWTQLQQIKSVSIQILEKLVLLLPILLHHTEYTRDVTRLRNTEPNFQYCHSLMNFFNSSPKHSWNFYLFPDFYRRFVRFIHPCVGIQ